MTTWALFRYKQNVTTFNLNNKKILKKITKTIKRKTNEAVLSSSSFLPSFLALVVAVRRTARALLRSKLKMATAALRRICAQLRAPSACFFS